MRWQRAVCASFFGVFVVAGMLAGDGCGSGGLSSSASVSTSSTSSVTAATESSPLAIKVSWTAPTLASGQSLIQYHIYRDGSLIATASTGAVTYEDLASASSSTLSYTTISGNGALSASTGTIAVSPVTTGSSHYYSVTYLYVDNSTGLAQYYEISLGTSSSLVLSAS